MKNDFASIGNTAFNFGSVEMQVGHGIMAEVKLGHEIKYTNTRARCCVKKGKEEPKDELTFMGAEAVFAVLVEVVRG